MIKKFKVENNSLVESVDGNVVMYVDHVNAMSELRVYLIRKIKALNEIMMNFIYYNQAEAKQEQQGTLSKQG